MTELDFVAGRSAVSEMLMLGAIATTSTLPRFADKAVNESTIAAPNPCSANASAAL
jgi:hypothetical protein